MAHSNNSVITGKLSGTIGKELVFRDWEGKTVVAKAPKARVRAPGPDQLQRQEKFLLASRYAKAVKDGTDQGIKDAYTAALRPRQNLFSRALEDYMSPPEVKSVNTSAYTGIAGSTITVRAVDDFHVTGVQVEIFAANGTLLEKGNAVQQTNGLDWTYTATQANAAMTGSKINAIATDVPGNTGTKAITL
jgi:hypothetical protein